MRFFTSLALTLSLLAVPVAASACGMEIDFDRKHTLVAKKADTVDKAAKASALKALLAEVDAKMEAAVVTETPAVAEPAVKPAAKPVAVKKVARK